MPSCFIVSFAAIAAAYIFLRALLHFTQDEKEPKAIANSVPFVRPLIGMLLQKHDFYIQLRDQHDLPIYTLRTPSSRIYVVNSVALVPAVLRQSRIISFAPIEAIAAANVMGLSKAGNDIMELDMTGSNFPNSYLGTFVKAIHPAVSPGPGLDAMNRSSIQVITAELDKLQAQGSTRIDLFKWIRHLIFIATTDAVYGPGNIFRDPANEEAWNQFEPGIMYLMTKLSPRFVGKASFVARESLVAPFERYFRNKEYLKGSLLVQCRHDHNLSHGLNSRDIACTEIGQMVAQVTNSVAAAFWLVYHIVSDPIALADCRRELSLIVQESEDDSICTVDLDRVKTSCPILLSAWLETLRYEHTGISARFVTVDHMLDNRYLLKKGNIVMIVNGVQHTDAGAWGPTAREFKYKRFFHDAGSKRPATTAFRGFGGGSTLCPGRHFASTEIMSLAALLVLRFDVHPVKGTWADMKRETTLTSSMPTPSTIVEVDIVARGTQEWRPILSGSDKSMQVSAEDFEPQKDNVAKLNGRLC